MTERDAAAPFNLRAQEGADGASRTISAGGELDSASSQQLVAVAEAGLAASQVQTLILDLREVTFIDSTGTHALVLLESRARERQRRLEIIPPPAEVTAALQLAGVAERISLVLDEELTPPADFLERIDLDLEREPGAPARARAEIRELLGAAVAPQQLANLVLLTSEVTTNAVVHPEADAGQSIGLRVVSYPGRIRIQVDDPGPGFDPRRPVHPSDRGGRGLMLVDRIAQRWGASQVSTPRGPRFAVWFELDSGSAADPEIHG